MHVTAVLRYINLVKIFVQVNTKWSVTLAIVFANFMSIENIQAAPEFSARAGTEKRQATSGPYMRGLVVYPAILDSSEDSRVDGFLLWHHARKHADCVVLA